MQSWGRVPPQGRPLHIRTQIVLMMVLFSLLGLAHALQANEGELDCLSDEFAEGSKKIAEWLDGLKEELTQTRQQVAETSVLTTRSVETLLGDLHAAEVRISDLLAAKIMISTRVAALEHRIAALKPECKHAATEARACSMLHASTVPEVSTVPDLQSQT